MVVAVIVFGVLTAIFHLMAMAGLLPVTPADPGVNLAPSRAYSTDGAQDPARFPISLGFDTRRHAG